jgi:hypothetical protein
VLQIWQDAGLEPADVLSSLAAERDKLEQGRGDIGGPLRGFVIPTLRSIGLFSPRIEDHFRDMFAANFGDERARRMNLRLDLPEDLDAWIETR